MLITTILLDVISLRNLTVPNQRKAKTRVKCHENKSSY